MISVLRFAVGFLVVFGGGRGGGLRWCWAPELTNERAPAGGPGTPRIIVPTIRVLLQYPSFREMLSTPVAG